MVSGVKKGGTSITHDGRPYTAPKLSPPTFEDAVRPAKTVRLPFFFRGK